MKRICLALLLCCSSLSAWPLGHLAGVEILDRDTGWRAIRVPGTR
jgi:hypothetical protein